ncbi:DUF2232 domain-containing protein [Sulfoacidibacillus thermotolerans]|uniref:DUF2232 domain-containing protein n=1 Tax=Sulfoacidibacillus thermotolerans TaxID=1765684 RepID=A0A2U3D6C2_SULT2|nr:DUF2232 domain-containing protein [Sulfoacidibacillus thermotolerans]PWI56828.1 hypothetical protein BM613_11790 [Sulfoacidibacillus thermotolerans]
MLKRMIDTAWGSGIAFFILLTFAVSTPLSTLAMVLLPVPLILLVARGLWQRAAIHLVVALVVLSFLGSFVQALLLLIFVGSFSYVLGKGFQTGRVDRAMVNSVLIFIAFIVLGLALLKWSGIEILPLLMAEVKKAITQNPNIGLLGGAHASQTIAQLIKQVSLYFPSFIVLFAIASTLLDAALVRFLLRRHGDQFQPVFRFLRFPPMLLVIFGASLVILAFQLFTNVSLVWSLANNVFLIAGFLLELQALSFLWWYLRQRAWGFIAFLFLFIVSLIPYISQIYLLLGVLDMVMDFRERLSKKG